MTIWQTYPDTYRAAEVRALLTAAQAGESSALIGLSGAGKSNLLGFLVERLGRQGELPGLPPRHPWLIGCDLNRLSEPTPDGFYRLALAALGAAPPPETTGLLPALEMRLEQLLPEAPGLCLALDRFDALPPAALAVLAPNLRSLRDRFKYNLSYIAGARRPPDSNSELAELFYANTLWLGPLAPADARWTVARFCARRSLTWTAAQVEKLIELSWGYPAFLRAACEAYAGGAALESAALFEHPALQKRIGEFWADGPGPFELSASRLSGHPWLAAPALEQIEPQPAERTVKDLTAKENLLWKYLQAHPQQVCEKDELVRAVWPEDRIFERGVRDDSLAQLVRRLREKIEPQPSEPRYIQTIPGRGYRFTP